MEHKIILGTFGYLSRKSSTNNAIEFEGRVVKNSKSGWTIQNLSTNEIKSFRVSVWNFTAK